MTEPSKTAGTPAGQGKADTGPVPDRPVSHPPGPQGRPAQTGPEPGRAPEAAGPGDRPVESATAGPGEKRAASRPLAKAAESGDPDVHKALADLQTARLNLADASGGEDRDARIRTEEQAVKDARARLEELGYAE